VANCCERLTETLASMKATNVWLAEELFAFRSGPD